MMRADLCSVVVKPAVVHLGRGSFSFFFFFFFSHHHRSSSSVPTKKKAEGQTDDFSKALPGTVRRYQGEQRSPSNSGELAIFTQGILAFRNYDIQTTTDSYHTMASR